MTLLLAGVVLWCAAHLSLSVAPAVRANLAARLGERPFKGLFAIDIVIALVLIVMGWKAATPAAIYAPPLTGNPVPLVILALAILLFVTSKTPNNLKRYIRHPQLSAVLLWGIAHLLTNGDSRSLVLFGGLAIWAILEMIFINRRDGAWSKAASVPVIKDVISVAVAAVVFTMLIYFHESLFGVAVIPA